MLFIAPMQTHSSCASEAGPSYGQGASIENDAKASFEKENPSYKSESSFTHSECMGRACITNSLHNDHGLQYHIMCSIPAHIQTVGEFITSLLISFGIVVYDSVTIIIIDLVITIIISRSIGVNCVYKKRLCDKQAAENHGHAENGLLTHWNL